MAKLRKTVKVKELLLGMKYPNKSDDWATYLFGQLFQRRLRADLHKNQKSRYTCDFCGGAGSWFLQGDKAKTAFINEIFEFTHIAITDKVYALLEKEGLIPKGYIQTTKSGEAKMLATPIYEKWLKKLHKLRSEIEKEKKTNKKIATKYLTRDEEVQKLETKLRRLVSKYKMQYFVIEKDY